MTPKLNPHKAAAGATRALWALESYVQERRPTTAPEALR
jgi:hypothetical protein